MSPRPCQPGDRVTGVDFRGPNCWTTDVGGRAVVIGSACRWTIFQASSSRRKMLRSPCHQEAPLGDPREGPPPLKRWGTWTTVSRRCGPGSVRPPSRWSCSPARGSRPTRASPTSADRRACGRRTRVRSARPRCSTTWRTPRCGSRRGATASTRPPGRRSPTPATGPSSPSSSRAGCTPSSPRTSTSCTSRRAPTRPRWSSSTAPCAT